MVTILLYGHLARQFGRVHRRDVRSVAEAVRALCATLPGFRGALAQGAYRVLRGGREAISAEQIADPHSARESLRIVPVVAGAGRGLGQVLLGAALIGASSFLPTAPLISGLKISASSIALNFGVSMVLGGIAQALSPTPKTSGQTVEAVSNRPSYAFDGAVNTAAQGNPVPVCYGRLIVGSQVISAGLTVEQI